MKEKVYVLDTNIILQNVQNLFRISDNKTNKKKLTFGFFDVRFIQMFLFEESVTTETCFMSQG